KNFSLVQLSGFMDLLNFLLENLHKHMTLGDNIKELGKAMAGIGETDSERSGDMDVFSIEEAKAIIDYLNISLFKPYKLYEHLFHSPREELVISNKVIHLACLQIQRKQMEYTPNLDVQGFSGAIPINMSDLIKKGLIS
uniref:Uncharacterized protein n=1 Tax=Anser brachyrhynchus TaxID=132585 RepID=A0A8B9CV19_9AVES